MRLPPSDTEGHLAERIFIYPWGGRKSSFYESGVQGMIFSIARGGSLEKKASRGGRDGIFCRKLKGFFHKGFTEGGRETRVR